MRSLLLDPRDAAERLHDLRVDLALTPPAEHHRAKLSQTDVDRIRQLTADGLTRRQLADLFGVSRWTIAAIVQARRRATGSHTGRRT